MSTEHPRRLLLTGASGLVGAEVHTALCRIAQVTCANDRTQGDLSRGGLPEGPFDTVVHVAAHLPHDLAGPDGDAAAQENTAMDGRVLDLVQATGAHLVYFSTASVFARAPVLGDDSAVAPDIAYAKAKLHTEQLIAARKLSACIFRLVAPYGARQQRHTVLRKFVLDGLAGKPLRYYGTGARTQDFIHVRDVAAAVRAAVDQRAQGTFVLASGRSVTMRELAGIVSAATGGRSVIESAGVDDPEEGVQVRYDIHGLARGLGFTPQTSLEAGVAEWAAALRAQEAP
jgi:UDP-glucose 4-epimerase